MGARRWMLSFDGPPLWRALSGAPSMLGAEGAKVGSRSGASSVHFTDEPERRSGNWPCSRFRGRRLRARAPRTRGRDLGPSDAAAGSSPRSRCCSPSSRLRGCNRTPPLVRELMGLLAVVSIMRVSRGSTTGPPSAIAVAIRPGSGAHGGLVAGRLAARPPDPPHRLAPRVRSPAMTAAKASRDSTSGAGEASSRSSLGSAWSAGLASWPTLWRGQLRAQDDGLAADCV
jgi:hypothetical protein